MPRKIVFINQSTGYLTIDIINEFVKEFDEVALVAGSIRVQDKPLDEKVTVSYITRYNRGNIVKKAASWLIGTVQLFLLLMFKYKDYEVAMFSIPPTAFLLAPFIRSRYSLIIYDLYPDALTALGFSKNGVIYRWWSKKNKIIFKRAYKIFTLSEFMKSAVISYSPGCNVQVIPNWSAFVGQEVIRKNGNRFIKKLGLSGKFVVQYSGNIGVTHHVETLVELADMLKTYNDIFFLIIGRGKRLKDIGQMIESKGLTNCRIIPFLPDNELFESLCAADLSVVTLEDSAPNISIPSKTYNILAAGTPMMVIASPNSGIADLIHQHHNGRVFSYYELEGMSSYILELKNDPVLHSELSEKSLLASRDYTIKNAKLYLDLYQSN